MSFAAAANRKGFRWRKTARDQRRHDDALLLKISSQVLGALQLPAQAEVVDFLSGLASRMHVNSAVVQPARQSMEITSLVKRVADMEHRLDLHEQSVDQLCDMYGSHDDALDCIDEYGRSMFGPRTYDHSAPFAPDVCAHVVPPPMVSASICAQVLKPSRCGLPGDTLNEFDSSGGQLTCVVPQTAHPAWHGQFSGGICHPWPQPLYRSSFADELEDGLRRHGLLLEDESDTASKGSSAHDPSYLAFSSHTKVVDDLEGTTRVGTSVNDCNVQGDVTPRNSICASLIDEDVAVTRIQAAFRGLHARKCFRSSIHVQARVKAAVAVQSAVRAHAVRMWFASKFPKTFEVGQHVCVCSEQDVHFGTVAKIVGRKWSRPLEDWAYKLYLPSKAYRWFGQKDLTLQF